MNSNIWAVLIVGVMVIVGLGLLVNTSKAPTTPTPGLETPDTQASTTDTGSTAPKVVDTTVGVETPVPTNPKTITVTYSDTGFSPNSVTIKKGDTVVFNNTSTGRPMWVGADEHPGHEGYDTTSRSTHCAAGYAGAKPFDQCAVGSSYRFTFAKSGSFDYHNHTSAQFGGTVVVQ
jgi:plastocyanin